MNVAKNIKLYIIGGFYRPFKGPIGNLHAKRTHARTTYIRRGAVDASDYKRSIRYKRSMRLQEKNEIQEKLQIQEKQQIQDKQQMTRQATDDKSDAFSCLAF